MSDDWKETLVAPMDNDMAESCAHYFAILHDLDLAKMSLVRMAQHQSMRGHKDADIASENIYFDYALMHYFRCFRRGDTHLNMKIFQKLEQKERREAKKIHLFLHEAFELQSKRPHKIFSQVKIGVALEKGKKKGVRDIFWLMNRFQNYKPEMTRSFTSLVSIVQAQVSVLAKEVSDSLVKEAAAKATRDLYETSMSATEFSKYKIKKA